MKLYADELPKSCSRCRFCYFKDNCAYCLAKFLEPTKALELGEHMPYLAVSDECPLQSLTDYTKQVRKEVVQEIINRIVYYAVSILDEAGNVKENVWGISKKDVDKILDQIQGETK